MLPNMAIHRVLLICWSNCHKARAPPPSCNSRLAFVHHASRNLCKTRTIAAVPRSKACCCVQFRAPQGHQNRCCDSILTFAKSWPITAQLAEEQQQGPRYLHRKEHHRLCWEREWKSQPLTSRPNCVRGPLPVTFSPMTANAKPSWAVRPTTISFCLLQGHRHQLEITAMSWHARRFAHSCS